MRDTFDESRLSIEIEPELRAAIESAAANKGISIRDYVVVVLEAALAENGDDRDATASRRWSHLSSRSFGRDWESPADAIYDDLA